VTFVLSFLIVQETQTHINQAKLPRYSEPKNNVCAGIIMEIKDSFEGKM
jgi:hypothetical protein